MMCHLAPAEELFVARQISMIPNRLYLFFVVSGSLFFRPAVIYLPAFSLHLQALLRLRVTAQRRFCLRPLHSV